MAKKKGSKIFASKPKFAEGLDAFVIGNGTSRKGLELEWLKDKGIVFGCNWFFRKEFIPHVLIASDEPITQTITKVHPTYAKNNWFFTWFPKVGSGAKKATTPEKFAAGPMGAYVAADKFKAKRVFLIGIDFFGFGSTDKNKNGMMNNLYHGEKHYPQDQLETSEAPTYRNWQRRFQYTIQHFPDVEFWHVQPFDGKSPERLRGLKNFKSCSFENFQEHQNNGGELVDDLIITEEDTELAHAENADNFRATIERQMVGQENAIYRDLLRVEDVLSLRQKGNVHYTKFGMNNGFPSVTIHGFEILIPFMAVSDKGHVRAPTNKELEMMQKLELRDRAALNTGTISLRVQKEPQINQIMPPVPPVPPKKVSK